MDQPYTEPAGGVAALVADNPATLPPPPAETAAQASYRWKAGIAAWLGWMFDGLDMHLYTLVAAPFVAQLLHISNTADPQVKVKSSIIGGAFLLGWALGGTVFGRLGDTLGRSRALGLTILTYAAFTGLSFFATAWWQLLIFRFLAALGIGGEWAVGSSLLAETWPAHLRTWVAAVLQTAVNVGVLVACAVVYALAGHERFVFLVGVLPAVVVFWIRRAVPEPEAWRAAKAHAKAGGRQTQAPRTESGGTAVLNYEPGVNEAAPTVGDLFRYPVRRTTLLTIAVCAFSLTAWWAFMFWYPQQLRNHPGLRDWPAASRDRLVSTSFFTMIGVSIAGNFFAGFLARRFGYRRAVALLCLGFFAALFMTYRVDRSYVAILWLTPVVGFCSGVFALFTMYLPPLFPTLLRSTGAGFSYNIGRVAAAFGTVFFGLYASVVQSGDTLRIALKYDSLLFLPAMAFAWLLPELIDVPAPREGLGKG